MQIHTPDPVLQHDFLTKKRGHNFTKKKGGHETNLSPTGSLVAKQVEGKGGHESNLHPC